MDKKIFGGRYEILEKIGAGGMAIVYKAKDQLLNRVVTVKVLREQFVTDQDFIRRFRREAQSAASLSHPNIVSIYDVGKEGDMEYIVMEYVEGRNLKEIIREYAPLSIEQSLNLGRQITEAIQNAHEHHIIHRDIKPHNILVTADGHAKVTDFGIALAVSSATVTHTEDIVGSVHYLSPEQAKGLQSNEQSDIYSVGIVLYELVTGKVPYDGETPIAIALKHLQEEPVLPSKINPRVDKDFETMVMGAIAKSPAQRYASAKELLVDLHNFQAGRPLAKGPVVSADDLEATQLHQGMSKILASRASQGASPEEKSAGLKKSSFRERRKLIAGGIAALCLLIVLIGGWRFYNYVNGEMVEVPNVVGKTLTEARAEIEERNLVLVEDLLEDFSETIPVGSVTKQAPEGEEVVRAGREIKLTISKGVDKGKMPDVLGVPKDKAENLISAEGFDILNIVYKEEYSPTVPKGYVMAQNPMASADWRKTGKIDLTISLGPLPTKYMPDVIGKPSEEATKILKDDNQLTVKVETQSSDAVETGVVINTVPSPGYPVVQGTEVTIVVSIGIGPIGQGIGPKTQLARMDYFNSQVRNFSYSESAGREAIAPFILQPVSMLWGVAASAILSAGDYRHSSGAVALAGKGSCAKSPSITACEPRSAFPPAGLGQLTAPPLKGSLCNILSA